MRFKIISSLIFLGTYSLSGLCSLDAKAEVSVRPYPPKIRQTYYSLVTRAEHIEGNLSPANSVGSAASEPKLWTGEEERLLLNLREEQHLPWAEISKHFPERSWRALAAKYSKLTKDLQNPPKKQNSWTPKEEQLLLELLETKAETDASWKEIAANFPGRRVGALVAKYRHLTKGYPLPEKTVRQYTAEEDDLIAKALELGMTRKEISEYLGRSEGSVKTRISILLRSDRHDVVRQKKKFTVADFELMREKLDEGLSWPDIATKYFPERPKLGPYQAYHRYERRQREEKKE